MSDSEFNEKSPLLNKISRKGKKLQTPKEVSKRHLKESKESPGRNPYVLTHNLSNSLSDVDSPSSIDNAAQYNRYLYYQKLHNLSGSQLVIPDHVLPREYFFMRGEKGEKQSSIITIFAIWNTMMGTSLLSMPWALQQSGFVLGIGLMVFMGIICLFTCLLVVKSADRVVNKGQVEFVDVCEEYLGLPGKVICFIFGMVAFIGAVIVYWVLMTNFLYNVGTYIHDHTVHSSVMESMATVTHTNGYHGAYCPSRDPKMNHSGPPIHPSDQHMFYTVWDQKKTVPFYLLALLLPLSSLKSPTFFTKFNALGSFSVLYINIFVIVKAVQWGPHLQFTDKSSPGYAHFFDLAFPALTGILGLALYIHNAILCILATNEKPENNARDTSIAYLCTTLTYGFVGIVFYVFFPLDKSCIEQVLLDNFVKSDVMTFVAQCGLLFQMMTVFPLLMYIIRVQIFGFLFNRTNFGYVNIIGHNCGIIALGVLMAVFYPEVGHIIRYVGSVSAMVYIFTLPLVVQMIIKYRDGTLRWFNVVFYGIFIVIGIVNFIAQFLVS